MRNPSALRLAFASDLANAKRRAPARQCRSWLLYQAIVSAMPSANDTLGMYPNCDLAFSMLKSRLRAMNFQRVKLNSGAFGVPRRRACFSQIQVMIQASQYGGLRHGCLRFMESATA